MLRTQFRSGVQEGYQGAVGQLGGIMGQARQQSAQAGFLVLVLYNLLLIHHVWVCKINTVLLFLMHY